MLAKITQFTISQKNTIKLAKNNITFIFNRTHSGIVVVRNAFVHINKNIHASYRTNDVDNICKF